MLFICYERCSTCKKAEKWMQESGVEYDKRDIKTENPTVDELRMWHEMSGLPLQRFFNTSGQLYRQMELKDKLKTMSDDEKLSLLATDGMLVKRPILVTDDTVLVGFKQEQWEEVLKV